MPSARSVGYQRRSDAHDLSTIPRHLPRVLAAAEQVGVSVTDLSIGKRRSRPSSLPHRKTCENDHDCYCASLVGPACVQPRAAYRACFSRCWRATRQWCARTPACVVMRTIMQPLLLMFVFTYVFPKMRPGWHEWYRERGGPFLDDPRGGGGRLAIIFQGCSQSRCPSSRVRLLERDRRSCTRTTAGIAGGNRKDRCRHAPGPRLRGLGVPDRGLRARTSPKLHVNWLILLTLAPLAVWTSAALGLPLGPSCNPCKFPSCSRSSSCR